jgi:dienelactone hydrolase
MRVEKISFKNSEGEKLGGLVYIPNGKGPFPAVVLIHGLTGGIHEIKNRYMCDMLMNNGFVALQFDFYDKPNNLSEPKIENTNVTQQVKTTRLAIDFIESLPYVDKNKIGLTGHSLGGMTIVIYAASKDPRIKALVVQSAVSQFGTSETIRQDGKKYDVYKEAEKIVCPALIFHGDEDEAVNFRQSEELIKHIKIKDKKLEIIKGADHCYYNKGTLQIATELMIDWFNKWLK